MKALQCLKQGPDIAQLRNVSILKEIDSQQKYPQKEFQIIIFLEISSEH